MLLLTDSRLNNFTSANTGQRLVLGNNNFVFCVCADAEQIVRAVPEDVRRETHADAEALPEHWNPL